MSKFSQYDEELKINCVNDETVYAVKDKMKKYIPSLENQDLDNFVVIKSRLLYIGTNETEIEVANRLSLIGDNSDSRATVTEIQEIIDGVVELKDKFSNGQESSDNSTDTGFIGTKLLDRQNHLFDGSWNILIDYNSNNKETGRYETGYWLEKGKTYKINGKSLEFKNDYVIDYENKEFDVLSSNRVNWNKNATLGVDGAILNLDAMAFENGNWVDSEVPEERGNGNLFNFMIKKTGDSNEDTGIQKAGDVTYDEVNKSLNFNEDVDSNPEGNTGYLKLNVPDVDFSDGFTFEIYGNLQRQRYKVNEGDEYFGLGLFCRTSQIVESDLQSMRFGWTSDRTICKFNDFGNGYVGKGMNLESAKWGSVVLEKEDEQFLPLKKDFYLTVVYTKNADTENKLDKVEIYKDGKLYGWTYYDSVGFDGGISKWNNDSYPFYVGVVFWSANFYFLSGEFYATRLYDVSLNENQILLNFEKAVRYRESFRND